MFDYIRKLYRKYTSPSKLDRKLAPLEAEIKKSFEAFETDFHALNRKERQDTSRPFRRFYANERRLEKEIFDEELRKCKGGA